MRFRVEDRSMEPSLKAGDYIIVNRWAYAFSEPLEGDVVVLKHPQKEIFIVKRITSVSDSNGFFVNGDNEDLSIDSRQFGAVKKSLIVGKALLKV